MAHLAVCGGYDGIVKPRLRPGERLVLRVTDAGCRPKRRCVFLGETRTKDIGIFAPCLCNMYRSVVNRVFQSKAFTDEYSRPPVVSALAFADACNGFFHRSRVCLPDLSPVSAHRVALAYQGQRRKRMMKAAEDHRRRPLEPKDAVIGPFVKSELGVVTKDPRAIQARSPRYHVQLARFLKFGERPIMAAVSRSEVWPRLTETTIFAKGLDVFARAELIKTKRDACGKDPAVMAIDFHRYDQHIGPAALAYEHQFYRECYKHSPEKGLLDWLLNKQLVNTGKFRTSNGTLSYTVEGCRMSGDVNTSLGNNLLTAAVSYGMATKHGLLIDFLCDGDDALLFCRKADEARIRAVIEPHMAQAGFKVELGATAWMLEHVEFCQSRPVHNGERYVMVRKPAKAITQDTTGFGKWTVPGRQRALLGAVGTGGGHLSTGVPVLQEYYRQIRSHGVWKGWDKEISTTGLGYQAKLAARAIGRPLWADPYIKPITARARVSFCHAFGYTPEVQKHLEAHTWGIRLLPATKITPPDPGKLTSAVKSHDTAAHLLNITPY